MDGIKFSSPTPFTPPTTEEDRLGWLRLIRSRRVGATTFQRLMLEHGSAAAALDALPELARNSGVTDYTVFPKDAAGREMEAGRKRGARLVCLFDADYPPMLAELEAPPPVLWVRGQSQVLTQPTVALVGARNSSSLGERTARKLAEGLGAQGLAVASGLARGIDTAAHGAALKTGTIAVMAGGVDVIYPAENATLAAAICDQGALISEQPIGVAPQARHFPRRNRIIAGVSLGTVVIEAAEGSGSLITARDAVEQGREVMAVPGHPMDARASGGNSLIRDGATLVRHAADVLEAISARIPRHDDARNAARTQAVETRSPQGSARQPALDTLTLHKMILKQLGATPVPEDQLVRDLDLPPEHVAPALLFLELDGRVLRQAGGMLARA